jgi:hypothetical protein
MEANLREFQSPLLERNSFQKILLELSETVAEASAIRDQKQTDDPALRMALGLVEAFLRRSHRLCYGGMAINAHMPKTLKFYDFSKSLPDYDFFTPTPEEDTDLLVRALKDAGFQEVSSRVGMHEGTSKVFVNFVGIADITFMPQWMYNILQKRALKDDGISYVDADYLRMAMYLELSRPQGEVERWEKVYKRLVLLNHSKPPHTCHKNNKVARVDKGLHELLIQYIAREHLVFAGAELKRVYENIKSDRAGYLLKSRSPVVAFADSPGYHVSVLRQLIHDVHPNKVSVVHWPPREFVPEMYGLRVDRGLVMLLIQQEACHSYNLVELPKGVTMRVASLDSAITLWHQLNFVKGVDDLVKTSIHCFSDSLVQTSMKTRDKGRSAFPLFSITCHGHQESKASLLRAKQQRIKSMKRKKFSVTRKKNNA